MADKNLNALIESRARLTGELRTLLDQWEARTGSATSEFDRAAAGELREKCSKLEADLDKLENDIDLATRKARLAKADERGNEPVIDTRGAVNRGGVDAEKQYAERYAKAMANFDLGALTRMRDERATTTTGTSNAPIPIEYQQRIVNRIYQATVMRQLCTIRNVGADQRIFVEGSTLPTAYKVAENVDITEGDPSFAAPIEVSDYIWGVRMSWTKNYRQDAVAGVEWLMDRGALALSLKLEDEMVNSASAPTGLLATIPAGQKVPATGTAATIADISGDDIWDLYFKVPPQFRTDPSCRFLLGDGTLKHLRKLKVAAGSNEYIWKPSERASDVRDGIPGTLAGTAYAICQAMPSPTTATIGAQPIVFGPYRYMECYDRDGGVDMILDPYTSAQKLVTRVIMSFRTDFVNTMPDAFASIVL